MCNVYVPLLLSASTTILLKLLKLEHCHHNSCVNVPKLPFSTRVNIQTVQKRVSLSAHMGQSAAES